MSAIEFPKRIIDFHGKLSGTSVHFLEFVQKNPKSLDRSSFDFSAWQDDLYTLQPWPTFVNGQMKNRLKEAGTRVCHLIESIPERIFDNDTAKIAAYFQIPIDVVTYLLAGEDHDHLHGLLARGDFVYSPQGLKCLEFNISSSLGGWHSPLWEPLYLNTSIMTKFFQEYRVKPRQCDLFNILFTHLIQGGLKKFPHSSEINVAFAGRNIASCISEQQFQHISWLYGQTLKSNHSRLSGEVVFCEFDQLNGVNNFVFFKDRKIHVVVELYFGEVPRQILQVFLSGNVVLYNGPVSWLLSNKLNLALLSELENSDLFDPEERETIRKYVPWTRKTVDGGSQYGTQRIGLADFVSANKDRLVLKPANNLGGMGITVGKLTPLPEWHRAVTQAFSEGDWVVQEYVGSLPFFYQSGDYGAEEHDTIWGIFVFGALYGGSWVRVLSRSRGRGIVNAHQGAEGSIVLEVEEDER
jgi:hypothetical protein